VAGTLLEVEVDVVYVALGSNLGDRDEHLAAARAALDALPGTRVIGASEVEETAPVGPAGQGPYLNQIVALATSLSPHALLDQLQRIELERGRVRDVRWGPRTLDLDVVCYASGAEVRDDRLTVPHPELPHRDFWRRELAQARAAAAAAIHPEGAR
jgi:2-amino-4-hydroxy-6-hydroxymethyldihydropteridine diphosphokinase